MLGLFPDLKVLDGCRPQSPNSLLQLGVSLREEPDEDAEFAKRALEENKGVSSEWVKEKVQL